MKTGRLIRWIAVAAAMLLAVCAPMGALAAPAAEIVSDWHKCYTSAILNRYTGMLMVEDYATGVHCLMAPDGTVLTTEPYSDMKWERTMFSVRTEDGVNKWGLIDGSGRLMVPMQYHEVVEVSDRWQLGQVYTEGSFFNNEFKGEDGKYYKFSHCDVYFDGKLVGQVESKGYGLAAGAYLSIDGKTYDSSMNPSKYRRSGSGDDEYDMTANGTFHIGSGQQVGVPECTLTPDDVRSPIVIVGKKIVDLQGNLYGTIEKNYDYVQCFRGGYAEVSLNDKVGLIDATGREVIPCEYDDFTGFEYFVDGYMIAVKDGKVGYLNEAGEVTVDFKYAPDELINYNWSPMTWKYNDDGSITVISAAVGELEQRFQTVNVLGEGGPLFSAVLPNGAAGVFDMYGNEIIPADGTFTNVYHFNISHDGSVIVAEKEFGEPTVLMMSDAYGLQAPAEKALPAAQAAPAEEPAPAEAPAEEPAPAEDNSWTCTCGSVNSSKFCPECGSWVCSACGSVNDSKFCPDCGASR